MMKTLLLVLLSTTAYAQDVHYDTILHKYYVDITPKVVVFRMPPVTRLYVNYSGTGYNWDLLCTPADTNRFTIEDGFKNCAVRPDSFDYIASYLEVTIIK